MKEGSEVKPILRHAHGGDSHMDHTRPVTSILMPSNLRSRLDRIRQAQAANGPSTPSLAATARWLIERALPAVEREMGLL